MKGDRTLALHYRHLSLGVVYASMLLPFEVTQFLSLVSKLSFIPEPVQAPFAQALNVSGIVARKGRTAIAVDSGRSYLGVTAPDIDSVLSEMDGLENLLKDELAVDTHALARNYDFLAEVIVETPTNPLEDWPRHFQGTPLLREFSSILGMDVAPYGLRISTKGGDPRNNPFFDIRVEPLINAAKKFAYIHVLCRDSNRTKVFDFAKKFESVVQAMIARIGEGK